MLLRRRGLITEGHGGRVSAAGKEARAQGPHHREEEGRTDGLHEAGGGAGEDLCTTRAGENSGGEGRGQGQPGPAGWGTWGTREPARLRKARRRAVGGS